MNRSPKDDHARSDPASTATPSAPRPDGVLRRIGDALTGLRYGSVLVIVQDGIVVQLERTEKTRLDR